MLMESKAWSSIRIVDMNANENDPVCRARRRRCVKYITVQAPLSYVHTQSEHTFPTETSATFIDCILGTSAINDTDKIELPILREWRQK